MMQGLYLSCKNYFKLFIAWLTSIHSAKMLGKILFRYHNLRLCDQTIDITQVKNVLVVRVDEIGDVVMTTPFLRELRRLLPDASITLVVKPTAFNLVELCPHINELLTYDPNTTGRLWQLHRFARVVSLGWRKLRHRNFDLAILPRWDMDDSYGSFVVIFSGARWRVGYSEKVTLRKIEKNIGTDDIFTHVINDRSLKHEVERNLNIIGYLGGKCKDDDLELWIGDNDERFASNTLNQYDIESDELLFGLGPSGGNSVLKQWPVEKFIDLGLWLNATYKCRLLIFGGPGEEILGRKIESSLHFSIINVVGKTSLREMSALMKRCHLFIGNDTGPMHVAAATGIPALAIFGSSCNHRFSPWGNNNMVISLQMACTPCSKGHTNDRCGCCIYDRPLCLHEITVNQVKEAVCIMMADNSKTHTLRVC